MTPPTTAGSASGPTECPNCGGTGTVMFAGVPDVVNPKPMTCICQMPKYYIITTASNGSHFVSASPPIAAAELSALRAAVVEYFAAKDRRKAFPMYHSAYSTLSYNDWAEGAEELAAAEKVAESALRRLATEQP